MCEMKRFLGDRCLTLCAGDTVDSMAFSSE